MVCAEKTKPCPGKRTGTSGYFDAAARAFSSKAREAEGKGRRPGSPPMAGRPDGSQLRDSVGFAPIFPCVAQRRRTPPASGTSLPSLIHVLAHMHVLAQMILPRARRVKSLRKPERWRDSDKVAATPESEYARLAGKNGTQSCGKRRNKSEPRGRNTCQRQANSGTDQSLR